MKVTGKMTDEFASASGYGGDIAEPAVRAGLEAVFSLPEVQALERFARAAAAHVTTDGVDEWNDMVDVWNSLPDDVARALLEKGA